MSNFRQEAIKAIATTRHKLNHVDFKKTHVKELFGEAVFNEDVQRQRLPKQVFKALQKTIRQGAPLDPQIADAVANAMRDWALEKGATHEHDGQFTSDRVRPLSRPSGFPTRPGKAWLSPGAP